MYKTECIRGPSHFGPWRTVEDVELATLPWVHWYNTQRLREYLDYLPPREYETNWVEANKHAPPHLPVGSSTLIPPRQRKIIEASASTEW